MLEKYTELNENAKVNILEIIKNKNLSNEELTRCLTEVDILFDKGLLFLVNDLYNFKKEDQGVKFYFRGMCNNLLILYKLGLSIVDPIKYNLPYELSVNPVFDFDIIGSSVYDFLNFIEFYSSDYRLIYGYHKKEKDEELDEYIDNHYLIIPKYYETGEMLFKLKNDMLETAEDYEKYYDEYLIVRIDEKEPFINKKVDIKNALQSEFEKELASKLKPNSIEDYSKVVALAHGTDVWNNNEEKYFEKGIINIHNIISTREDVLEYLLKHNIPEDNALEITNYIRKGVGSRKDSSRWDECLQVLKKYNCDDMYIDIFKNIKYLSGRGQAISECIYAIDENNYIEVERLYR